MLIINLAKFFSKIYILDKFFVKFLKLFFLNKDFHLSFLDLKSFYLHYLKVFVLFQLVPKVASSSPSAKGIFCNLPNGFTSVYLTLPVTGSCLYELPRLVIGRVDDFLDPIQ